PCAGSAGLQREATAVGDRWPAAGAAYRGRREYRSTEARQPVVGRGRSAPSLLPRTTNRERGPRPPGGANGGDSCGARRGAALLREGIGRAGGRQRSAPPTLAGPPPAPR